MKTSGLQLSEKHLTILGWLASMCAIAMYVSYIDQIRLNLAGDKGSLILPMATVINCCLWIAYGFLRSKPDIPIIVANLPGVVLGLICFITAL